MLFDDVKGWSREHYIQNTKPKNEWKSRNNARVVLEDDKINEEASEQGVKCISEK